MKILALEPYYGGSHRAFLDGWIQHSRHAWTALTLPAYKWKWRMRHAAITFASQIEKLAANGQEWDLLITSDMLDLATLLGMTARSIRTIPRVVYFHENQLTYPFTTRDERDHHFGFTNFTTALAADAVWFNSRFHLEAFYAALRKWLLKMPDHRPEREIELAEHKSSVQPPGVDVPSAASSRPDGPLRILWAARWEHDKNPETFFEALEKLDALDMDFRLDVIGESFRQTPPVFHRARTRFAHRVDRWGYQPTRQLYQQALKAADVFVSTANHEFFGIAAVEAIAAGAYPLLPRRLAYPEVLAAVASSERGAFFYDGDPSNLARQLAELANRQAVGESLREAARVARAAVAPFRWPTRARAMDDELQTLA